MPVKLSRRYLLTRLVKITGVSFGALTFGKHLSFSRKNATDLPQTSWKKESKKSGNKILVAYESQFGSTAEVANFIGNNIDSKDKEIDVLKIKDVISLSEYSQVIVGSAIQYDKWMPEAREFVQVNETELATKSVSYFLVCLALSKKTEKAKRQVNGYATKTRELTPKITVEYFGQFAGVLDYSKMSLGQRIIAKGIFAVLGVKEGDYRDWDYIKEWTKELPS